MNCNQSSRLSDSLYTTPLDDVSDGVTCDKNPAAAYAKKQLILQGASTAKALCIHICTVYAQVYCYTSCPANPRRMGVAFSEARAAA